MNKLAKGLLYLLTPILLFGSSKAQESKYWIFFSDKGETSHYRPEQLLSPRALERRATQNMTLDLYDFPVSTQYLSQLKANGIETRLKSRWLNAVSAFLTPEQVSMVVDMPFVKRVEGMSSYQVILGEESLDMTTTNCPDIEDSDVPSRQLSMVGLDQLHELNYTGEDVLVAVFDNGYLNVNELPGFAHLTENERIIATKDYVDGDENLYHSCAHCRHGTYVFSILAAKDTALGLTGSAPEADFILFRTENDASETNQEEDNWVAAAEFADSMGAQVFTTSLGYYTFDGGIGNYTSEDRDGNTSIITRAADLAASRGIVVVNSAGNSAARGLVMPADGDSVMAIGAVDGCAQYASFSSQGPSFDGRVKPDISAMGQGNFFIFPDGTLRRGSGTSFSCPIASGLSACLIQAFPSASNIQIYEALKQSSTQYNNPDNLLGYGIPNAMLAMDILEESTEGNQLLVYPNPTKNQFSLVFPVGMDRSKVEIQLIDMMGRRIDQIGISDRSGKVRVQLPDGLHPGYYIVRAMDGTSRKNIMWTKILIEP